MFGGLGFIDLIALAFAALLLAGAAAAVVLALMTNRAHMATAKGTPTPPSPNGGQRPVAAATTSSEANGHIPLHAVGDTLGNVAEKSDVVDLRDSADTASTVDGGAEAKALMHQPTVKTFTPMPTRATVNRATPEPELSPEAKLAERAARLRQRTAGSSANGPHRVVGAVEPERTPAHAKTVAYAPDAPAGEAHERAAISKGFSTRTPGFFEDPLGRHELRYWDGKRWTEYVKERGERFTDPL